MADTWGSAPYSAFNDERLDGASLEERGFLALVLVYSNDVYLFEGDPHEFARLVGASADDVERLMDALEEREIIRRYQAPGRRRLVGEVLGPFEGESFRKANPSQRTKSFLPFEDGTYFEGRASDSQATRKQPASDAQAERKQRAKTPQATRKQPASDAQAERKPHARTGARDHARSRRAEQSRAEQSSAPNGAERSAYVASVSAPAEPALGGAGSGATENQPVPTTKAEPSAPPVQEYMRPDSPERPPDPGETWEAFKARYPWPTDADYAVDPWARTALNAEARARGVKPRELREAVTRERHGPPRVPLPDLPDDEVLH